MPSGQVYARLAPVSGSGRPCNGVEPDLLFDRVADTAHVFNEVVLQWSIKQYSAFNFK